ncbi:MAG: nicotinate phosphoribosyltransferase, partial [Clostridiales bacterium]|nr:nicotinate phosphoribosyltransferase [Candidatus Apopatocola equi]
AVPEGTPVFPREPLPTVRAPAMQAQLLETFLLLTLNPQSLIATKANRVVRAAQGRSVMEFGSRRAQGADAAILGARAAYIAGCSGTACTITDELYGVKALGTMAHSWVQMFPDELSAFKAYCECYPDNAVLLVDTYDVLSSGVPNAIRAFDEVLRPLGVKKCGIRLDSGDLAYLTKQCRRMLDEAGWESCTITCSNSLDEYAIRELLRQGGQVDSFGVGERMITASSEPVFGGVYKLVAVEDEQGVIHPRIKISENVAKITVPGFKKTCRFFDEHGMAAADCMFLRDEEPDFSRPFELFDPEFTWKRKVMENYTVRELQVPVFLGGELVYELPTLEEIRAHCAAEVDRLWEEVKRFDQPHCYYVDLSQKLWDLRDHLLRSKGRE